MRSEIEISILTLEPMIRLIRYHRVSVLDQLVLADIVDLGLLQQVPQEVLQQRDVTVNDRHAAGSGDWGVYLGCGR